VRTCSCIWRLQCRLVRLRCVSARHQQDNSLCKSAKMQKLGGVPYPPEVTNFTPSLPLDRPGQGSQSTEFANCCVASIWHTVEDVHGVLRCVQTISRGLSGGLVGTTCGELDYGSRLVPVQPVKPFHDVVDVGSGFQILKNGGTGIRVPFNTHAPLTLPGMLSTAGHSDQSIPAIVLPPFLLCLPPCSRA
jgi:hypothetical protein